MDKIIVSDTTTISHLTKIGQLNILKRLYTQLLIPEEVFSELMRGRKMHPEMLKVKEAEKSGWIKVFKVKDRSLVNKLQRHLDLGESEAITLSMEMKADLLIIDEVKGRELAGKMGINIIGAVGVLIKAKEKGKIQRIKPYLKMLRDTGFRMKEDFYMRALAEAGETE